MTSFLNSLCRSPFWSTLLPVLLGSSTGLITRTSVKTWYPKLHQPKGGNPPRWAFPVIWTSLYAAMGYTAHVALWSLERSPSVVVRAAAGKALTLYWIQLGLNMAWTPLFFGLRRPDLALVDISVLTGTVAATAFQMYSVTPKTLFAYIPYLGWLSYATYLTAGIFLLNDPKADRLKRKDL